MPASRKPERRTMDRAPALNRVRTNLLEIAYEESGPGHGTPVLLMHGMFRRVLGERAALLVAVLLPCSVLWLDKVPSAEIDMLQVAWVTAAVLCFLRALEIEEGHGEQGKGKPLFARSPSSNWNGNPPTAKI